MNLSFSVLVHSANKYCMNFLKEKTERAKKNMIFKVVKKCSYELRIRKNGHKKTKNKPKFTGSKTKMTFLFQLKILNHSKRKLFGLWDVMQLAHVSQCVKAVKFTQCHENNTAKMCQKKEKTFRKYEI